MKNNKKRLVLHKGDIEESRDEMGQIAHTVVCSDGELLQAKAFMKRNDIKYQESEFAYPGKIMLVGDEGPIAIIDMDKREAVAWKAGESHRGLQ